jgi:TRAP-type mannitol/chloroaromatic compound transport system permease small subunit
MPSYPEQRINISAMYKAADKIVHFLEQFILKIGHAFSWLSALLIFAIIVQVVFRYVFNSGLVKLEELQWHLYGALIMVGLSYANILDSHVRVDLLYQRFSKKTKSVIEIGGIVLLLIPFLYVVFFHSLDFVKDSFIHNEHSAAPNGLPYRWLIKAFIPLGCILFFISSIARLLRSVMLLFRSDGN